MTNTRLRFDEHMLLESLDKPWELEDHTDSPIGKRLKSQLEQKTKTQATRFKFFSANSGNGHVIEYAKDGAMEVHHLDEYGISGKMNPDSRTPNMGFVATMANRVKHHLESGFPVRIIGTVDSGLFGHYHRLGRILAKKHGAELSEPVDHEVPGSSVKAKSFTISPGHNVLGMSKTEVKEAFDKHHKRNV